MMFADDTAEGWLNTFERMRKKGYTDEEIDLMIEFDTDC